MPEDFAGEVDRILQDRELKESRQVTVENYLSLIIVLKPLEKK